MDFLVVEDQTFDWRDVACHLLLHQYPSAFEEIQRSINVERISQYALPVTNILKALKPWLTQIVIFLVLLHELHSTMPFKQEQLLSLHEVIW